MKRSAVALLAVLVALAVSVPLAIYGSLRPCEILRQDLRMAFRAAAGRMAGPSSPDSLDQAARKLGAALATAIADPAIDQLVVPLNPFECGRLVVRLKVDPEGALDDLARVRR